MSYALFEKPTGKQLSKAHSVEWPCYVEAFERGLIRRARGRVFLCPFHEVREIKVQQPGTGWPVSEETKREIDEMEQAQKLAHANARGIVFGFGHLRNCECSTGDGGFVWRMAREIERLNGLLEVRDAFIVDAGLWSKFVASLPK